MPRIGEDNGRRPSLSIHDGVTQRRSRTLFGAIGSGFGFAVAGVPDQSGDGVGDFAIAAPLEPSADGYGRVYIHAAWLGRDAMAHAGHPFIIRAIAGPPEEMFGVGFDRTRVVDGELQLEVCSWMRGPNRDILEHSLWVRLSDGVIVAEATAPRVVSLGADLDRDDEVSSDDWNAVVNQLGGEAVATDLDGSGVVDPMDLAIVGQRLGESTTPDPEPYSAAAQDRRRLLHAFRTRPVTPPGDGEAGGDGGDEGDEEDDPDDDDGGGDDGGGDGGQRCSVLLSTPTDHVCLPDDGSCLEFIINASGSPWGGTYEWRLLGCTIVDIDDDSATILVCDTAHVVIDVVYAVVGCTTSVHDEFWVLRPDLDIDNNDGFGLPDRGPDEELIESIVGEDDTPGKVCLVRSNDDDHDGVPGIFDGYGLLGLAATELDSNANFVPLVVELGAIPDFSIARVRLLYDASLPALVRPTLQNPFVLPLGGSLRLWIEDVSVPRHPEPVHEGGDFIAPGEYWAHELPFQAIDDGQGGEVYIAVLYAEVVAPSLAVGDIPISIAIDPDGDGPADFQCPDTVVATGSELLIEAVGEDTPWPWLTCIEFHTTNDDIEYEEGEHPGSWMSHRIRIRDPRGPDSIEFVTIDGTSLPLVKNGEEFVTPEFLAYLDIPPDAIIPEGVLVPLSGDHTLFQYNPTLSMGDPPKLKKPPKYVQEVHKLIDSSIGDLEAANWDGIDSIDGTQYASNDSGAFGKEVHRRVGLALKDKSGWVVDVWVDDNTKSVVHIGEKLLPGMNAQGLTQVDLMHVKHGYHLNVGDVVDPSKVDDIIDIKTSLNLEFTAGQEDRLRRVIGGRDVRKAVPVRRWTRSFGWHEHVNGSNMRKAFKVVGVTGAVTGVVMVNSLLNYSEKEAEFEARLAPRIMELQRETDPNFAVSIAAEIAQEMSSYMGDYLPDDTAMDFVTLGLVYHMYGRGE